VTRLPFEQAEQSERNAHGGNMHSVHTFGEQLSCRDLRSRRVRRLELVATRLLPALGLAAGGLLLARPRRVVDAVAPQVPRQRLWLVRALGVRLLVQHGAVLARPERPVVRASAAVDLLHAASMVPFLASPRYGRAARISGGGAAAYAAVALAATSRDR
jgi:hypothetical protein